MTLADLSKTINCYELRATTRTPSGIWNLYCKKTGQRTTEEMCAACKRKQPIRKESYDKYSI